MEFLKRYPLPVAGLILALFALGNAVEHYGEWLRFAVGGVAFILYLPYLARLALRLNLKEPLSDPVTASRQPAFAMATLLLGNYAASLSSTLPVPGWVGVGIWYAGLAGHVFLILWFSVKFILRGFSIKNVYPSWFTVYAGIAAASVTAPGVGQTHVGQQVFWFALGAFLVLLPFVCWRAWWIRRIPNFAKTTMVVFALPAALLLAGYTASFEVRSPRLVTSLTLCSSLFYLIGLGYYIVFTWKRPDFTPDHADFAFPIAISALASRLTADASEIALETTSLLAAIEAVFASLIVMDVLIHYLFLLRSIWQKARRRSSPSR
ncbi:MAG: TDT family transporter [Synergistaceae bacterium]|nr:TDT family transporter [Synergistaceae bacterium]